MPRIRNGNYHKTHGLTRIDGVYNPLYTIWQVMLQRCYNPNNTNYHHYGGRGVTVCDQWRTSFETFMHDVGPRPTSKHTLDRIDNNGAYAPGNTQWSLQTRQIRNSRKAKMTLEKAQEARRMYAEGWSCREIGLHFGVSKPTIQAITSGKTWKPNAPLA